MRKSVTEPVEDNVVFSEATLIEDLSVPESVEATLQDAPPQTVSNVHTSPVYADGEKIESEKVLTIEERRIELSLILTGITSKREAVLRNAEESVKQIQKQLDEQLKELDKLYSTYSSEYAQLTEGAKK